MTQHGFPTSALLPRYVTALVAACAAGVISTLGSAHFFGAQGIQRAVPALLVGAVMIILVLAVAAFLVARHADGETIERMSRHLLWVVFAIAAVPGLIWFVLWISGGSAQSLFGLAAIALGGLPLVVARRKPAALPLTTGFCLLVAVLALVFGERLFLLLPISVAVTGGWMLTLALLGYARHRRTKTVVPSN
ncbi:hypothetical protein FPZ12_013225 [Amycolatopsis acidicola]|uniref:Uncharacterized protein n=1 Tax=Amycolatopsis acidicola TaxID=2596893 RepID=A0A5N0VA23_9PSEU|nr:hypothetical protein [Amycolatopsis acidicola]KAA9161821.1 hypothetical protein FPZ12_013225 [Amycolatopsis acidicola]